jgi:hypothetical protein
MSHRYLIDCDWLDIKRNPNVDYVQQGYHLIILFSKKCTGKSSPPGNNWWQKAEIKWKYKGRDFH